MHSKVEKANFNLPRAICCPWRWVERDRIFAKVWLFM